jgi:tetratricopeptide (TPR) repeat protein
VLDLNFFSFNNKIMDISLSFQKLKIFSFYSLILLLPIFFVPFLNLNLNLQKLSLFTFFLFFLFIGWWSETILSGRLRIKNNKLFYLFLFSSILFLIFSSFFSSYRYFSFLPHLQNPVDNFLTIFFLFLFLFLVSNIYFEKKTSLLIIFLFLLSFSVLNFILFVNFFLKKAIFQPLLQPLEISVLSALFLPLYSLFLVRSKGSLKIFFIFSFFVNLFNFILFNFKPAFLILIFQIIFLVFLIFRREKKEGFLLYFSLFLLLTLSFLFYFFPSFIFSPFPFYLSLPFLAQVNLILSTFHQGLKYIFFGSGPGTFLFQFLHQKPLFLNQTIFWNVKLNDGFSFFFDSLITKGILFSFSFLILAVLIIFYFLKRISKKEETIEEIFIFCSFLGSFLSLLFLPSNFLLTFIFFLLLGILSSLIFPQRDIQISQIGYFLFNILFVFLIFLFSFYIFVQSKILIGEFFYQKGVSLFQKGKIDEAIDKIQKAAKFNERSDLYFRDLSQLFLFKLSSLSQNQDDKNIQFLISNAIEAIERAIKISPENSSNWNVRGFIFRNLLGLTGAKEVSLNSYRKSADIEPTSPFPYGEMARIYILSAQKLREEGKEEEMKENLREAREKLKKALELKPDYTVALYLLAVASDQEGNLDEAISFLEKAIYFSPQSYLFNFSLAQLYFRKGGDNLEKALIYLDRAISLNQNSAEAHFLKGAVLFQKGEKEKAILEFEKAQNIVPENEKIKEIVEKLKKGEPLNEILKI